MISEELVIGGGGGISAEVDEEGIAAVTTATVGGALPSIMLLSTKSNSIR